MTKIRGKGKLLLYATSGMGINLINLMMNSYLCSALLVGGFGESAIKNQTFEQKDLVIAAVWGIFVVIAKIIDGIIDIPMASFTDGLKTRWGRRKPALIIGLVPLLLSYVLFLFTPDKSGVSLLNTIFYGIVLCVFYSSYTLTMVTYYATFTEIVDTEKERSFLANVKSVCDIFYFIIGYVLVSMLLKGFTIRKVALLVMPLTLLMLIPLFMIKENGKDEEYEKSETVNLVRSLTHTFKNKAFIVWMCVYSFMNFGVQLFLGGINEYFSFVGMNMMIVMSSTFAPVPFALIFYNYLKKKKGFGFSYRYTLLVYAVGMLSMFGSSFIEDPTLKLIMAIVSGLFCSLSVGAMFAVAYSVPSQLAAEEEKRTGISNSAMYFAVQGLFAGVSSGIGSGLVLTALKGKEDAHSNGILFLTLIAGLAMLVACALTVILPKSIINMGKEEK